ncbi:MAG: hypothetical protein IJZ13_08570 [Clostridia bacterium]|nr:hypothetical protein [Clostridia bacterium]
MRRLIVCVIVLLCVLSGCVRNPSVHSPGEYTPVEPVGEVPAAFADIVKDNLFQSVTAFEDRLLCVEEAPTDTFTVRMYDYQGAQLAIYSCEAEHTSFMDNGLIATSDGGFLFVLGFYDEYDGGLRGGTDGLWASENGVSSRIVKCTTDGRLEWACVAENYDGSMLQYAFEGEDAYYFFGAQETPETDTVGVYSPTDIHLMKMSKSGTILKTATVGGGDYDSVNAVQEEGGAFDLYCRVQSDDGDFSSSGEWRLRVDAELQVLSKTKVDKTPSEAIGLIDGKPVTAEHALFKNFEDGRPSAVLDYDDFYLVVSENITGIYEDTPLAISSIWYYTETVYGAYDESGKLLWKATVDSSPDYDAMRDAFESEWEYSEEPV